MLLKDPVFKRSYVQVMLLVLVWITSLIIFSAIGGGLTFALFGENVMAGVDYTKDNAPDLVRFMQMISFLGAFIIPPVIYSKLVNEKTFQGLGFNNKMWPWSIPLMVMLLFFSQPILGLITEWNAGLVLPEFLRGLEEWMKMMEEEAMQTTLALVKMDGVGDLLYVLFIIAVLPALGEEMLFRGALQPILIRATRNAHIGIWLTAIIFSALHMQFYGFVPRMLLGAMFGYLFLWTGSLWVPIVGHLLNNGLIVLVVFFNPEKIHESNVSLIGESQFTIYYAFISLVLSLYCMYLIQRRSVGS